MIYTNDIAKLRIPAVIIACLLFVGCKKERPALTPDNYPIILAPTITQPTKYNGGTDFENNDAISVFSVAWNNDQTAPSLSDDPTNNNFHNAKFVSDATYFHFVPTTSAQSVGFPPNGKSIDIYAFYPYNSTVNKVTEYEFTAPADQSTKEKMLTADFLFSKAAKVAPQLQPVNLVFNHTMAKVVADITFDTGYQNAGTKVASIKFYLINKAKINIAQSKITSDGNAVEITPFKTDKNANEGCTAEAIVAPQDLTAAQQLMQISMTDNKVYTFNVPAGNTLATNTITTFKLKLSKGESNAATLTNVTITNWSTGASITSNDIVQNSENKFTLTAKGNTTSAANVAHAAVEVLIDGETRTYELPATYNSSSTTVNFEFRGIGNRPNKYPFTVKKITLYDSSWNQLATESLDETVSSANQVIKSEITFS